MPHVWRVWSHRRKIGFAVGAVALLGATVALLVFLLAPVERMASIQVRVLFAGAAEGKYPNGTTFSPTEFIAIPVLTHVYEANQLSRFDTFANFKNALTVLRTSPALVTLSNEYNAKLADPRLAPIERNRLEEEFRQKRAGLSDAVFSIVLRRTEGFRELPRELAAKTLNDILTTWSGQAANARNAVGYNVTVLSRNILQPDILETEDYLVVVDMLRVQAQRLSDNILELQQLPGAETFRTPDKERVSLAEVRTNLEDVTRLQIQPLAGLIRAEGLTKDPRALKVYIDQRLFDLGLNKTQAEAVRKSTQEALGDYVTTTAQLESSRASPGLQGQDTVIPQLSEGFLDRLIEMVKPETSDVAFRQRLTDQIIDQSKTMATIDREISYYTSLSDAIQQMSGRSQNAPALAIVQARSLTALNALGQAVDRVGAIYAGVSQQNLNPSTHLYTVTAPFSVETHRSVQLARLAAIWAISVALTFVLACAVSVLSGVFRGAAPQPHVDRAASRKPVVGDVFEELSPNAPQATATSGMVTAHGMVGHGPAPRT